MVNNLTTLELFGLAILLALALASVCKALAGKTGLPRTVITTGVTVAANATS